jgi:hypothetical protein
MVKPARGLVGPRVSGRRLSARDRDRLADAEERQHHQRLADRELIEEVVVRRHALHAAE